MKIFSYSESIYFFHSGISTGIYTTNSPEACQHILETSNAKIVIVDDWKQLEKIQKIKAKLPNLRAIVQTMVEEVDITVDHWHWSELEAMETSDVEDEYQRRASQIAANECCMLIYTSGTLGKPKGVMLSHDNLTFNTTSVLAYHENIQMSQEVIISYLPLSHACSITIDIIIPLSIAATVYFADRDALKGSLIKTLIEVQPTLLLGVPRMFEKIREKMAVVGAQASCLKRTIGGWAKRVTLQYHLDCMAGQDPSNLQFKMAQFFIKKIKIALGFSRCKYIWTGSAPMNMDTKKFFLSIDMRMLDAYGMTETSTVHLMMPPDGKTLESLGQSLPGFKTKIVNANESGHGEICMRGRDIFMGYLNDEEKTKEAIDDEGWLHSGDVGKMDEDGFVYLTGRIKELLITAGGENIPMVHIENLVKAECTAISNAFLVGDQRKFLTFLITLRTEMSRDDAPTDILAEETLQWLKTLNLNHTKLTQIIAEGPNSKVLRGIQEAIDRANRKAISNAQKVQKFAILPNDFSIPTGELGPTMKVKRSFVLEKYKKTIEEFYK